MVRARQRSPNTVVVRSYLFVKLGKEAFPEAYQIDVRVDAALQTWVWSYKLV